MKGEPRAMTPGVEATVGTMGVDLVTAEVARALAEAGVSFLLLKGPSLAALLYRDGTARRYLDTDLLVPPDRRPAAEAIMRRLGFEPLVTDADIPGRRLHANCWFRRADGSHVDLHRTLIGVRAPPERLWATLARDALPMRVGGRVVEVPSVPARALHVALHAAQHGARGGLSLTDLERALGLLDDELWRQAAGLARELEAVAAFATGLRLREPGRELAARLDLPTDTTTEVALWAASPPPTTMGFEDLARAEGMRARIHLVARRLVPTRRYLRVWSPLARRGRLGLVLAYGWRPLCLLGQAPRGFLAWRRGRRATRR